MFLFLLSSHWVYIFASLISNLCISFSVFLCVGNDGGGGSFDRAPASTLTSPIRVVFNIQISYFINW
jgi:hypothetical protein